jgi:hypothetical protein
MNMPNNIFTILKDIEVITAIIFGAIMQFIFGTNRSIKVGFIIILSSIFVSSYLILPLLNIFEIENEQIKAGIYATSSLISVELMAVAIAILPEAAREKAKKFFGIKDDTSDKKR